MVSGEPNKQVMLTIESIICASLLWMASAVAAVTAKDSASMQADLTQPTKVEVFWGPKLLKSKNPKYPHAEQLSGGEGWILMQFMVDTAGEPYEISVVDSVGSDRFERASIVALEQSKFEPASAGGQPIDAGSYRKITYALAGGRTGAGRKFVQIFKALSNAIEKSEQARADELFAKLNITNLYEDAFYNFLMATYYVKWGTASQQLGALRRAVAHEESAKYLPQASYLNALQRRFALELQLNAFSAAEVTAALLEKLESDESRLAKMRGDIAELAALRNTTQPYAVAGNLGKQTSWWLGLFRNKFHVKLLEGEIAELKLRCRKGYVFFRYDPELEYSVPKDHMPCGLEVLGDPGTRFSVIH